VKAGNWYKADDFKLVQISAFQDVAPTAIESISESAEESKAETDEIYTIQGVKISRITSPGLYIVNGKKIYVK
jgi:hypothetical protein